MSLTVRTGITSQASHFTGCSGPFKLRVKWSDNPVAGWHLLGAAGVETLCPGSRKPGTVRAFSGTVP